MKTQSFIVALLYCCVLNLLPVFAAEQKSAMTGTITEVSGTVEILKRGESAWRSVVPKMKVGSGDQINAGVDGRAVLTFENSVTEIKPVTLFTVGRAIEGDQEYQTEMFLQLGKVISTVDKNSGKRNKFTITTPTAVAGVRGTQQEVSFGEGFGTETRFENGEGFMAPVQIEKLPPAIQMALGVAPAVLAQVAPGAPGRGPEGAPPPGAAGRGPEAAPPPGAAPPPAAAPGPEAAPPEPAGGAVPAGVGDAGTWGAGGAVPAEAVSAALDLWLQSSFDVVVGAAPEPEPVAAGAPEAAAPEAEAAAAALDLSVIAGEVITVGDGLEASIGDPVSIEGVVTPDAILQIESVTDVTTASASEAEQEAALSTTEVIDAPPSVISVQESTSDQSTQTLLKEAVTEGGGGTPEEVDAFGLPLPPP